MNSVSKYALYLALLLSAGLFAMYQWRGYLFEPALPEIKEYTQCEKVFVGKMPWACQPGDLIFVDADVAEKYCTEEVFSRSEDTVYCVYNGHRDDRERQTPPFKAMFKDIKN